LRGSFFGTQAGDAGRAALVFRRMSEVGHVTRLSYQGKEILIVGTAHVSERSVEEVRRVIREERPNTVCVELDEGRYQTLIDKTRWQKLDIFQVIREKKVLFLLSSLALSAYQRRMGERLGVVPGAELLAAVETAKEVGAEVRLVDRDVQATLKRTWANLGMWDRAQIVGALLSTPFTVDEIDEEKIEQLKDKDTIGEMLHQVAQELPKIKTPLIDERDQYLMSNIQEAPGPKIVGVVGAAHVAGMVQRLGEPVDRAALEVIPGPSALSRSLNWLIPLLIVAAFGYGYYKHQGAGLEQLVTTWALSTATLSGLFTIAALGHPLSIVSAFLFSPITALNPAIGIGMVTGLVEAYFRRPTVADCEGIQQAFTSVRGVYQNRVSRVMLVFMLSNLGAALGSWIGLGRVLSLM